MVTGCVTSGREEACIEYAPQYQVQAWDIVPGITQNLLASTGKFANAGYITVLNKEEANIYDESNIKIPVTRGVTLKGWRDKESGLWRIPLVKI